MFDALLISEDQKLITELQKIAAVTQCSLEINSKLNNSELKVAHTVLIDAALDISVEHPEVVLVTFGEPGLQIWQKAVATGAKYVAFLPDAREWLIQNLIPRPNKNSRIIGVLGASGGLGCSLIASSIAANFATSKKSALLVETDLFSGGLDVLWGIEETKGSRWSDLINHSNQILPIDIFRSLPKSDDVSLLSSDSKDSRHPENLSKTIEELSSTSDLVVIDLPKPAHPEFENLFGLCTEIVLLVGSTIKSISAANQLLIQYLDSTKILLVVRNLPGTNLSALNIAKTLKLELIGQLTSDQKITEHIEQGLSPAKITSSSWRKSINEICANLETENVRASA